VNPAGVLVDLLQIANVHVLRLLVGAGIGPAREYCSKAAQRFDELAGRGLRPASPLECMYEAGWAPRPVDEQVQLPIGIHTGGGTRLEELVTLAMVTRVLRPRKIFEIGTYMGRTTSVLRLNAEPRARVVTLDLPEGVDEQAAAGTLATDVQLIRQRRVGALLHQLGIAERCDQLRCDSMLFDPSPHRGTVELGFIDGAHSKQYVENDTAKMAVMMAERGLVFWHDYGGKGRFRDLTLFLDSLSSRIALHRVLHTSLAWTTASELRKVSDWRG
jgi:predicted O-methyltransferase YrrM